MAIVEYILNGVRNEREVADKATLDRVLAELRSIGAEIDAVYSVSEWI